MASRWRGRPCWLIMMSSRWALTDRFTSPTVASSQLRDGGKRGTQLLAWHARQRGSGAVQALLKQLTGCS